MDTSEHTTPKIKRTKRKDKIKERKKKMGKYSSKHVRQKINNFDLQNKKLKEIFIGD
jgi:hypothetical protein